VVGVVENIQTVRNCDLCRVEIRGDIDDVDNIMVPNTDVAHFRGTLVKSRVDNVTNTLKLTSKVAQVLKVEQGSDVRAAILR
jgi:arginine/ornithine N-succinyltransferase beta subunit